MKGLDLSRMKKISSDDKTTVFRHDNGHEVKIAHAALSPKMMEQLGAIPVHGQKMAEGGSTESLKNRKFQEKGIHQGYGNAPGVSQAGLDVRNGRPDLAKQTHAQIKQESGWMKKPKLMAYGAEPNPEPTQNQDAPPAVADGTQDVQPQPASAAQDQQQSDQTQAPAEQPYEPADQEETSQEPTPPPPADMSKVGPPAPPSSNGPVDASKVGPPAPAETYQNNMENLSTQDAHFAQSLNSGEIKPETYSDLFAKKSTLGKIGMIFGLMVGSAGAGLSHQQNALLAAMNQEINNDLDAQKQSKNNAQNWLRLSQQHQQLIAENKVRAQQAQLIGAQTKSAQVEAAVNAQTLAQSRMQYSVLHNLYEKANMIPADSPQKPAAQQVLNNLSQAVDQDVAKRNHQASTAISQSQAMQSNPNEDDFNNQVKAFTLSGNPGMAEYMQAHHVPGLPGQTEIAVPQDVRGQLNAQSILDNKGKDLLGYIKQHTGSWNPQTRAIASQKIEEMKNFYNDSIKGGALTQGRLGWYDEQFAKNPTDILPQVMGSTAKLQEMVRSNESRMNQTIKSYGGHPSEQTAPNANAEVERLDPKTGKIVIYDAATKKPLRWK